MEASPSSTRSPPEGSQKSMKNPRNVGANIVNHQSSGNSFSSENRTGAGTSQYGQSLASVLNNPRLGKSGIYNQDASWGTWLLPASGDPNAEALPPPLAPGVLPDITRASFQPYLDSVSESYGRFSDVRRHENREQSNQAAAFAADRNGDSRLNGEQGDGLQACLREIPFLYFAEDFALEKGSTFQSACPFSTIPQNMMLQEKLSHYLDLVEFHLVREISARSDSFFEALDQLEDLNSRIVGACDQISELQGTVRLLDSDIVDSARHLQGLQMRRNDMLDLYQKLKLLTYVNQAMSTLRLLVAAGDCSGTLDVIDDLQQLLSGDELVGLHCFRHLGGQLSVAVESVNSVLAEDFVRTVIHHSSDLETSALLSRFTAREKGLVSLTTEFESYETSLGADEEGGLRDQLLPIVIGLLRTSKLSAVLRTYKDALINNIKSTIKTVVAELLPILFSRTPDAGEAPSTDRQADMDVGGVSLAFKLRALTAENFGRLLAAVFAAVQSRLVRAARIRVVIEQIIGGLQGSYAAEAVAAAFASGAAAAAAAETAQEGTMGSFGSLSGDSSVFNYAPAKTSASSPASNMSKQFRADVLLENTEAVCAACDAAHGRWAKLLGVRAHIHPKLRLEEFVFIYNITQEFISATEKVGGRLGYSIRGTLQSQSKSFVDNQHNIRVSKITAILEQENWTAVDAPDEFQAIVDRFTEFDTSSNGFPTAAVTVFRTDASEQAVNQLPEAVTVEAPASDESARALEADKVDSAVKDKATGEAGDGQSAAEQVNGEGVPNGNASKSTPSHTPPVDATVTDSSAGRSKKTRERPHMKSIQIRGSSYHCVNCGLILLKMIAEYINISDALPALATEIVHRVAEILKLFNSRSCQLVLGAGAMQVAGLKSITAKHLALASQTISLFYALIPDVRKLLAVHIPDSRKGLLLTEIDRVRQDYRVHKDEIHSKLVAIMKDRLLTVHLPTLSQTVETWNRPDDGDNQASPFAKGLTKEVGVLHRVLSPLLLEQDVRSIFTRIVLLFHSVLADAYSKVDASTPQAKSRLYRDIQVILTSVRGLPSDNVGSTGEQKPGELDELLVQRFGAEPPAA
ncbi:vacuolar protein sorting-associated protein 54, chloroplastic [Physcomitrium patens]|uniref:Vacuolar protein sorting-associated protein 54 C-terminal domain-containing protein n=1 Tax=Physcomitrium patens TaxID=3218 RepID=A0A2K1JV87_PHYPA|nr:vacuolar protein sorting-associated protein 54, chloroplastic-like [Physcomitrium patens]PNR45444.1 hypothetical protein PHYPA_015215 [Physcomitrium patens]|eukprot:XP_024389299.1 vacuolar protein sorting-associated protein 54, chloroplastic-like [Physcomitrella patens]